MKRVQTLKANYHTKNGAIIVADIEKALLVADKTTRRLKQTLKTQETKQVFLSIYEKNLPNKNVQS